MTTTPSDLANDSVTLGLEYEGPALANHEMDVRDLAAALLSTGSLFQELNRQVNPTSPGVAVNVRATSEGSFLVELRLLFEAAEQGVFGTFSLSSLVGLVSGSAYLIEIIKRRRFGREVSREILPPDEVRVTYSDDLTLTVPAAVLRAADSLSIQRDLAQIVSPLDRDGVETVSLLRDSIVIATVNKSERGAFPIAGRAATSVSTELGVSERIVFLTIRSAGFETGRWGFTDGAARFTATIRDESFLSRVHNGEQFSELDVLRCRIRETQSRDERGLHSSIEVLEVIEHLPPAQGVLPLAVDEAEED